MYENCAFTGHRVLQSDFDYALLDRVILNLIRGGTVNFYCGMAQGFDIAAAESVINFKKTYPIKLIACVPCAGQEKTYTESNLRRYLQALESCDEKIVLSENYYEGCMFARDRFMVENCDVLICYQRRKKGGTSYTVNYAKKLGKVVVEI